MAADQQPQEKPLGFFGEAKRDMMAVDAIQQEDAVEFTYPEQLPFVEPILGTPLRSTLG